MKMQIFERKSCRVEVSDRKVDFQTSSLTKRQNKRKPMVVGHPKLQTCFSQPFSLQERTLPHSHSSPHKVQGLQYSALPRLPQLHPTHQATTISVVRRYSTTQADGRARDGTMILGSCWETTGAGAGPLSSEAQSFVLVCSLPVPTTGQ